MRKVLVLGYGYTGESLSAAAVNSEFEIIGARREVDQIKEDISKVRIDLTDKETFHSIPKDISSIVYMASASKFTKEAYHKIYHKGLKNILEYSKNFINLKRLLFVSSTGVYADRLGGEIDETSERDSRNPPQSELIMGENLLLNNNYNFETSVVRFSGIYGKEREYLIKKVKHGDIDFTDETFTNRIHKKDCGRVLLHLLKINEIKASYIASDDFPATRKEVYTYLAKKLSLPILETKNEIQDPKRYGSKRCINKLLRESGFDFYYPSYKEGYSAIIKDL